MAALAQRRRLVSPLPPLRLLWRLPTQQLPPWLSALRFAGPAGAASLCLVLSEQPHKLALGAIQAADGASMLAYYFSFVTPFGPMSLTIILICGGVLGLAGWPTMWLLLSEYLPAARLPYLDTWARDGLVAGELLTAPRCRRLALQRCERAHCGSARPLPLLPPSGVLQTGSRPWRRCRSRPTGPRSSLWPLVGGESRGL